MRLARALVAEFAGTAFLLATVVGSGILAHKLDMGNVALSVLCVAFATGAVLFALISTFATISAHFNPVVTMVAALRGEFARRDVLPYVLAQVAGACAGVIVANLMFELPAVAISTTARAGAGQWLGELVATFGLILVISGSSRGTQPNTTFAVPAYVAGAIYFTSSTCFANPAVTVARMLTGTLTGIAPGDVAAFIGVQICAALLAMVFAKWLFSQSEVASSVELSRLEQAFDDSPVSENAKFAKASLTLAGSVHENF